MPNIRISLNNILLYVIGMVCIAKNPITISNICNQIVVQKSEISQFPKNTVNIRAMYVIINKKGKNHCLNDLIIIIKV